MTVKELIAALRKFPPNAQVATAAHDNNDTEIQYVIRDAQPFDERKSTMSEITKGVGVVLR